VLNSQGNSKSSRIQQSRAKPGQRKSKKKAWISLDSLVRNEPFQWVTLTPWAFFFFILLAEANNNFADP
jgi:hypothetical protein